MSSILKRGLMASALRDRIPECPPGKKRTLEKVNASLAPPCPHCGYLIPPGGWPEPSQSFELTRVPRPSSAWAGPLSGRMLPHGWKDTCLLSPPRGPLGLDFYPLRLLPAPVKGSGQECPSYTSQSSGWATNPRVTGFR